MCNTSTRLFNWLYLLWISKQTVSVIPNPLITMQVTRKFMQHLANVILFTRPNCSLCESAKVVIQSVSRLKSFEYREMNIMSHGQESWKQLYEFDTPVVRVEPEMRSSGASNCLRSMYNEFSTPTQTLIKRPNHENLCTDSVRKISSL